ncbi:MULTISPECIES: MMPL/RND family transporter [Mycobacterium]|jgi:RND superfamily putative drug exporter|uniref:Membrane transport protein MMPL domain-containing protein n=6 Tax=Mycobacterium TaxID=1763 RepID=A0A1X1ZX24_9MYCO|nr:MULTISPECIES: MMPL family transporter [Mycobacterium]ASL07603.1 MmpL family transport protein [Mycobacterium intracellulare subsp. chimaera]ASL13259.1 MmpL family transport protein [Mycobacterium intracellulare subsp. chimaera]ASL19395.1 MmpL family transport protein [Mycobacterium intracellulare subsp. chimaera]ETZ38322.1 transport family protein [Mycobacterium intracellulare MIN_052511_1280]ETZ38816.1 transport family protein [Mycobacterium intracellulare MIN_052511_1280]
MTDDRAAGLPHMPVFARTVHKLAVPVVFAWVGLVVVLSVLVPSLDAVAEEHTVSMSPKDAPSMQAMKHIGKVFNEFNSDSAVMIVLEGDKPLGDEAHHFYDQIVRKLEADTKHVQHVQDFWGDPLTAAGSQSSDGKAAYVQAYLAGNQGESLASESVAAVRKIVDSVPAPSGVKAYVTGAGALIADQHWAGQKSLQKVTIITFVVIIVMLLWVYRSIITVFSTLFMVVIEVMAARGVVAFLAYNNIMGLSTFAVNILVLLAIAAGTDYAIFILGRYQEARGLGEDREKAFYTMFHGTAHVVLGSGLTIAGAMYCLSFTRLPYFQTMGIPCAVGMLVAVAAALTLGPAVLTVGSFFKLFDPKRKMRTRGWRRVGTAIVRWPGPILAVSVAIALIGLLALPGYQTNYDNRLYLPPSVPANIGYAAAERHFPASRMNPELLMIETDHDMRNPAGMLVLDRIARGVFHIPGVARVQAITRPLGTPIEHTSIPFQISMQNTTQVENQQYMHQRMDDMLKQADAMQQSIDTMQRMYNITSQMAAVTHHMDGLTHEMLDVTNTLRDNIANFDDFFRPIRSYFYWEKHCFDIPGCWSLRSLFDALDGLDQITEKFTYLAGDISQLDALMPQMLAQMPPMIATMTTMKQMMLTMHSSMSSLYDQMDVMSQNSTAMGQAFDAAKNDDSFYIPPEVFDNPDFKRGLKMFLSPDGHAARFIISHEGDPATPEGISHVEPIKNAAKEAIKGTPLEGAKIYLAGTAAVYKDMRDGSKYDLMIAAIAAASLILIIMLIITRSLVAAVTIVGTVLISLGASFGLSVLVWQDIIGFKLHWMVLAMSIILMLAVGSDYNLLLVSRFKEEIGAGLKTGIIRSMAGTGAVVTSAGLVFAATMASFIFSDLKVVGQVGTTIGLGLLFDTLIVRSFMMPSVAALLGRWFWWPQQVRTRPASQLLRPYGPRSAVRAYLLPRQDDPQSATTDRFPAASPHY